VDAAVTFVVADSQDRGDVTFAADHMYAMPAAAA